MKTVARFATRLQEDSDGLFLGALFRGGREHFKPNTIYEIQDILGVLTIVEKGMACGAGVDNCASKKPYDNGTTFSWLSNIESVLDNGNKFLLTLEENNNLVEKY